MSFDAASPQPSRQPEPVSTGLESQHRPRNRVSGFHRLIAPTLHQPQQGCRIGINFFRGRRSTPGTTPAASQVDWLISRTATNVLFCSKACRDRLRSFNCGMGHLLLLAHIGDSARPRRLPHSFSVDSSGSPQRTRLPLFRVDGGFSVSPAAPPDSGRPSFVPCPAFALCPGKQSTNI